MSPATISQDVEDHQSRDAIDNVWGDRTPYKHQWPVRVDECYEEKPDKWVQSACVLCSNGCGMDIGVKDGKVVGVRGRATDRVNKGRLGPKGMYGWKAMNHPDRLKHPLIRKNGKLEKATWDEAMSLVVKKSKETQERLSNHGIAFYTSGQLFLEEYYCLAMVGKAGLSTLHMDGNTRLCTATAAASMRESFGSDGQPGSYGDIDYTDCILMVGHNMASTQTVLWSRILDRLEGANPPKLIVVDPRLSDSASKATVHLAPKIGTNVALLNGIEHLIFKNGFVNEEFTSKHVIALEELRETVKGYTPQKVEMITGVKAEDLIKAAEIICQSPTLLSTALQGVYQSNQATAAACQINNINLLLGRIGRPGSGIFQMNGQPTAQNNRETGCDGEFPGFRNHQNPNHVQEMADIWNIPIEKVPAWSEPTHVQNLLTFIDKESIQMLWVSGTNPLVSLPNLPRVRDLLTREYLFLVVQDIYLTETAEMADVVLPAAQWGEKTGCYTNVDRTVHLSHQAVEPPGEAKADMHIFLDYAKRMGFKDKDGEDLLPWTRSEQVFEAWKKMSKGRPCDYSGLTYEKLTGGSGIQWPCNEAYPFGKERLFDDGKFFTETEECESFGHDLETGTPYTKDEYKQMRPDGRAILKPCHYLAPLELVNDEYPLQLSTGRNKYHFHTRSKTGRSKKLQDACPAPLLNISQADADKYNVQDGEVVIIKSRRGQVELPIRISSARPGQTFLPFHFGYFDDPDSRARAANELTSDAWDPISKQPLLKAGAIRIEKISQVHVNGAAPSIHAPQQQKVVHANLLKTKHTASAINDSQPRTRCIELWLGQTYESLRHLIDIYNNYLPALIHDAEIEYGLRVLSSIAVRAKDRLAPLIARYKQRADFGARVGQRLRDALFPEALDKAHTYEILEALQGLHVYLSHIQAGLSALEPASAALWDPEFKDAVAFAEKCVHRMVAWNQQQIKVRAPQTLVVPARPLRPANPVSYKEGEGGGRLGATGEEALKTGGVDAEGMGVDLENGSGLDGAAQNVHGEDGKGPNGHKKNEDGQNGRAGKYGANTGGAEDVLDMTPEGKKA